MSSGYTLVGKRVRIHLYDRRGIALGSIEGRVSDYSAGVVVGQTTAPDGTQKPVTKDLVYVTGIEGYKSPHVEQEGEGWFAVQDIEVVEERVLPRN